MKKIFLFLFLLIHILGFSQTSNVNKTGLWFDTNSWSPIGIPNLVADVNITISSGDTITATSSLNFKKDATLTIKSGGMLILLAGADVDLAVDKNFTIIVENGGTLHITGDIVAKKVATFTISGNVGVTGDINFNGTPPGTLLVTSTGNLQTGGVINGIIPNVQPGGIVLQNDPTPLPIELLYFKSYYNINKSVIIWSTSSELNNDYFILEYSIDGILWDNLAIVKGAGNSLVQINYTYEHHTKNSYYYKLSQVDYNGETKSFNLVFCHSPFINEEINYSIYDNNGRFLGKYNYNELPNLNYGLYILNNGYEAHKYIK